MSSDNGDALQAFGTTPTLITYTFNLVQSGSDTPRLGSITIHFPEEDYDAVLAYLDKKCAERYFEDAQWGAANSNVYLFEDGIINICYSDSPLTDPAKISEETRDRYIALNGILYSSQHDLAAGDRESFELLWIYSTAETDFVTVDNTK